MATRDLDRWLVNHEERALPTRPEPVLTVEGERLFREALEQHSTVVGPDSFVLTVRQTNNLVRFLMMNGWISHEQHPDVHLILRAMTQWLEEKGIEVSLGMSEL